MGRLSLIQQRLPKSKDRIVNVNEAALLIKHQAFVASAIAAAASDGTAVAAMRATTRKARARRIRTARPRPRSSRL